MGMPEVAEGTRPAPGAHPGVLEVVEGVTIGVHPEGITSNVFEKIPLKCVFFCICVYYGLEMFFDCLHLKSSVEGPVKRDLTGR